MVSRSTLSYIPVIGCGGETGVALFHCSAGAVTVLAGGTVEPVAASFQISADAGSDVYGICSTQFLDREFQTVRYELTVTMHDPDSFTYTEDTQLRMKGRSDLFTMPTPIRLQG